MDESQSLVAGDVDVSLFSDDDLFRALKERGVDVGPIVGKEASLLFKFCLGQSIRFQRPRDCSIRKSWLSFFGKKSEEMV